MHQVRGQTLPSQAPPPSNETTTLAENIQDAIESSRSSSSLSLCTTNQRRFRQRLAYFALPLRELDANRIRAVGTLPEDRVEGHAARGQPLQPHEEALGVIRPPALGVVAHTIGDGALLFFCPSASASYARLGRSIPRRLLSNTHETSA